MSFASAGLCWSLTVRKDGTPARGRSHTFITICHYQWQYKPTFVMEVVNFFSALESLGLHGTLQMSVTLVPSQPMAVSFMLHAADGKSHAATPIAPLTLSGSGADLDQYFLQSATRPLEQTSVFLSNVTQYNADLQVAREKDAQKRADRTKSDADHKSRMKSQKERDFDAFMKNVADFETKKDFRQAVGYIDRLGKKHPDFAGKIAAKRAVLLIEMEKKEGGMFPGTTLGGTATDPQTAATTSDQTDEQQPIDDERDDEMEDDEQDDTDPDVDPFATEPISED